MLNQRLFDRIAKVLGDVKVVNQGTRACLTDSVSWARGLPRRRTKLTSVPSEEYRVNCPFCGDQRQRLYINHLYGQKDPANGFSRDRLVCCHNEECHLNAENLDTLARLLIDGHDDPLLPEAQPKIGVAQPSVSIAMPTGLVPITDDDVDATAAIYLENRGFDLQELRRLWRVYYCEGCEKSSPKVFQRIVYPITRPSTGESNSPVKLCGWQARSVRTDCPKRKYRTAKGLQKSAYLYGLPWAAMHSGPVVVCEGVTDVWRLKTNAVSILGKTLSLMQRDLLRSLAQRRTIAFLLDSTAQKEAELAATLLRSVCGVNAARRVFTVELPKGRKDAAECTYEEVWDVVAHALRTPVEKLKLTDNFRMQPIHPAGMGT